MNKYDNQTKDEGEADDSTNNASQNTEDESSYPVPTNFSRHLWLFLLIVLSVCLAAIISWLARHYQG